VVRGLIAGGLLVVLVAAAVYGLPLLTSTWTPADLPVTATATRGELVVTVTEKGELEAIDAVNVNNELEGVGKLVSIVPEGTVVKKGETVAQLDADELTKLLNKQRVTLQAAEVKVKESESEVTQSRIKEKSETAKARKTLKLAEIAQKKYTDAEGEYTKELKKLQGALELARRELVEAQDELEFTRKQLRRGFGDLGAVRSRELGVQEKEFKVQSAASELGVLEKFTKEEQETKLSFEATDAKAELERTVEAQKSLVQKTEDQLANAKSTRDIEKETLDRIQKQIDQCTIKAPADGMVIYSSQRWYGEQGQIRPGATLQFQQPIFSLPDFSKMRVKMKVHESQVKKVQTGQKANLRLEAIADRPLTGTVSKIGTVGQNDGYWGSRIRAYETHITLDEVPTDAGLKPGMSAEVKILVRKTPDALLVPVSAVAEVDGQKVVYLLRGNRVERREVQTGDENEQFVQILDGLTDGEQVALDARARAAADLKGKGGK
jgi:RND family efflux transporter MFP subunit